MIRTMGLVLAIALAAVPQPARADAKADAVEHFKRGNSEFDLGHYKVAAREFEAAYKAQQSYKSPADHTLLFNIGQAYRLGGEYPSALRTYKTFLEREPRTVERASVERQVAALEKLVAAQKSVSTARPLGTIPEGGDRASDHGADQMGGAQEETGKRILILATEQNGPQQLRGWTDAVWGPGGAATTTTMTRTVTELGGLEAVLSDAFSNAGFDVIDPGVLRGRLQPKDSIEMLNLNNTDGRNIALRSDADLVLLVKGTAQVAQQAALANLISGQANVAARVIRVSDGKVLASVTQHAAQVHIDADTARSNALIEAGRMAGAQLTQKLGQ
jgi:tetratricopeptide (TPR) repeat protein